MAHLFDPFYTTKETGMGMGLAISQTIIDDHNGAIRADSEPGRGTVFHLHLPLAEGALSSGVASLDEVESADVEPPLAAGAGR
jgi:signal transduction histidine kinase